MSLDPSAPPAIDPAANCNGSCRLDPARRCGDKRRRHERHRQSRTAAFPPRLDRSRRRADVAAADKRCGTRRNWGMRELIGLGLGAALLALCFGSAPLQAATPKDGLVHRRPDRRHDQPRSGGGVRVLGRRGQRADLRPAGHLPGRRRQQAAGPCRRELERLRRRQAGDRSRSGRASSSTRATRSPPRTSPSRCSGWSSSTCRRASS